MYVLRLDGPLNIPGLGQGVGGNGNATGAPVHEGLERRTNRGVSAGSSSVFRHANAREVSASRAFCCPPCSGDFVQNARETRHADRLHSTLAQGGNAGIACRAAGQNIVDQEDIPSFQGGRPRRIHGDRPLQFAYPVTPAESAQRRSCTGSPQSVDAQLHPANPRNLTREQRRLVITTPPKPMAVQGDGYGDPVSIESRQPRRNEACHHSGQGDPVPMLEGQHQLSRGLGIERCRRQPVMRGRILQARRALQRMFRSIRYKRPLAGNTGWLPGDDQSVPASGAEPALPGDTISAQRAARRIEKVHNRRKNIRKRHRVYAAWAEVCTQAPCSPSHPRSFPIPGALPAASAC